MQNIEFSLFEGGTFQTEPTKNISYKELIRLYQSNENQILSEKILNEPNEKRKAQLKLQRAYYTPYGTFTRRNNESLVKYNEVIAIDIDGLKDRNEAENVRNKLAHHESILFCLLSTRGKGVKALISVNKTYTRSEQYKQLKHIFKPYLAKYLNIDSKHIDEAQFKLSQPCYLSYDKDMIVNSHPEPLHLEFNYKEPEPKKYKPIHVPNNANSRIEKYLLNTLKNKIQSLNPNAPRHPQLYGVKFFGQLLHYAPQLENEILSTYIESGVRLYGSESKRSNVTKTIQSAFKEGVNEPINNATIESIINDVKTPVSPPKQAVTNQFTCNDYLSNNRNLVDEVIKSTTTHKNTIITAPTGSGKTTLFTKLSNEINKSFVFLVPTRTIAEQSGHPYILGETPPEQIKLNLNHKLVFSTYASAYKLGSYKGKIVVIDESHLLSDRANIHYAEIKTILKICAEADSVIWLSATTNKILSKTLQDVNTITVTKTKKPLQIQPIIYNPNKAKQANAVIKWITSQKEGKNVIFWNNKEELFSIKKDLIRLGIYKADEIATYTANTSDTNSEHYNELIENSRISKKVKIILATSKIGEGVNVNNTDIFNVLFVGNKDINHFAQSLGRFRQSLAINCSCLFSFGFIEQKAKAINEEQLYSDMFNQISNVPKLFYEVTEKEQPTIKIDWTEHATIFDNNGNQIINTFELLHQIKKVKESYYNLETWQRDIIELMPEVSFNQYKLIEQSKNNDLDNSRKARKEQKSKFLEEVREQLKTDNAGAILHEIRETTKNTHLKSFIDEVIYDMPISELDTNNKILLYEYYDNIENYVSQIKQLMNIIGLLNYSDLFNNTANLFNDNYKQSDYNNLVKRIYASNLKTNGAQSYEEAKSIESLKRIKNAFKPYLIDGKATIKREEVFKILRRNLHYRFRQETKAVLIEKIGSLFDVDYCKNTKSFILDEVSIKDYQRIKFIYNKTKNLVSSQTHNGKELQSVFNPLN